MNIRIQLSGLLLMVAISVFCQTETLTIAKSVLPGRFNLTPTRLQNLQWVSETQYAWVDGVNLKTAMVNSDKVSILLGLNEINKQLLLSGKDSLKSFPFIRWKNQVEFYYHNAGEYIFFDIAKKSIAGSLKYDANGENADFLPDLMQLAYTIENNLLINVNGKVVEVTSVKDKNIVHGQIVSRNEFGINKGTFWSPKGNFLAFYRKDESKVASYPLIDINGRIARVDSIKYPMAGEKSENVSLGIYQLATGRTIYIEDNPGSEQYLTNITWSPDEKYIYIQVLNRDQNHMKLNKYDVGNGKLISTLFEETHPKYIDPLQPLIFAGNDPGQFLFQSKSSGYNHLYLYNSEGKLLRQLTSGSWEVTEVFGFSPDQSWVFYMSTQETPLERHCYMVNIKSGKITRLTKDPGEHYCAFTPGKKYVIDWYSNTSTPLVIKILSSDQKISKTIHVSPNPLENYNKPLSRIGILKSTDKTTDLYYQLILPVDFDSTRKYPAVVYVYGGPHNQMISNSWLGGVGLWQFYMAQHGYIMFTLDNRGSEARGFEFESCIHRQCGVLEMADQMAGVNYLKTLPFVDTMRLGVHGWSYGGFMTLSLAVNNPDVFRVAVAGGPVIDWKYYEVMYGERYMDRPDENPEGYKKTSLLGRAADLKAYTLIIHGAQDPTVVWQSSLLFLQECISKNIPVDYFVYPLAGHNMTGIERVHLYEKISAYFDEYLKMH